MLLILLTRYTLPARYGLFAVFAVVLNVFTAGEGVRYPDQGEYKNGEATGIETRYQVR